VWATYRDPVTDCKDLIIDGLNRVEEDLRQALEGLSADQLAFRPAEHANSVAWLVWHLTRVQDHHVADMAGRPQTWIEGGWHQRFGRPANANDTGFGNSPQDVASLRPEGPDVLIEYHAAVHARSVEYVATLSCQDMDRIVDTRWNPPVTAGVRLMSVINDCTQHAGQASYVRGLIEGRKWLAY